MKSLSLVGCFIFSLMLSFSAWSSDHDHDHDEFPEGTEGALLILEGTDAITKEECQLFIMETGYSGPEQTADQFYAKVLTGYSHGADTAPLFEVKPVIARPGVLSGTGANGQDRLALFLESAVLDLRNIRSFNLRWIHGNHPHTNQCQNMKLHEH